MAQSVIINFREMTIVLWLALSRGWRATNSKTLQNQQPPQQKRRTITTIVITRRKQNNNYVVKNHGQVSFTKCMQKSTFTSTSTRHKNISAKSTNPKSFTEDWWPENAKEEIPHILKSFDGCLQNYKYKIKYVLNVFSSETNAPSIFSRSRNLWVRIIFQLFCE